jgi:hypothetical protein
MKTRKLDQVKEQICLAYRDGQTMDELSSFHGASKSTIRNCLIENGEPLRPKGRRKKTNIKVQGERAWL